jgi:hypothetical protein
MDNFSEGEKAVINLIENRAYRRSLELIRESMEKVWASDVSKIIKNSDDYCEKHCEMIFYYVDKILKTNKGVYLSQEELFMLSAAIYLHDLGMHSDINKINRIKKVARKFGLELILDFSNYNADEYVPEVQKEIRNNQHLITAAWIDTAFRDENDNLLGKALRRIPDGLLISDLIDICKYHSKLPINECPKELISDSNGRKQLITALLRLADELDIDSNRISSVDLLKYCTVDPNFIIRWWIHGITTITFRNNGNISNEILINIRLNEKDSSNYGEKFYNFVINSFLTRNNPVLNIIVKNGLPIVIDANSGISTEKNLKSIPTEISSAIEEEKELLRSQEGLKSSIEELNILIWDRDYSPDDDGYDERDVLNEEENELERVEKELMKFLD